MYLLLYFVCALVILLGIVGYSYLAITNSND